MRALPTLQAFAPDGEVREDVHQEENEEQEERDEGSPIERADQRERLKQAVLLWRWRAEV